MNIYRISSNVQRLRNALIDIGVDEYAMRMVDKGLPLNIYIKDIKTPAANILKQEALASGMDAAVNKGVITCSVAYSDALVMGSRNSFYRLIKRLKHQYFGLSDLADDLKKMLSVTKKNFFIARGRKVFIDSPLIMGILNVTPDSFSDGGLYLEEEAALNRIKNIVEEGADIIDIGGASSRPGAKNINKDEEISRIIPIIKNAVSEYTIPISVDTFNSETAFTALKNGVSIINDISGLSSDRMAKICAETGAAVCIMHKGKSSKMNDDDISHIKLISEIKDFFSERIEKAIKAGIMENSIILDVGFCFGKTVKENYLLLKYLSEFDVFGMPILVGLSRKSMIGEVTGRNISEREAGSIAANSAAILSGADILRVHDVAGCVDAVNVVNSILKSDIK